MKFKEFYLIETPIVYDEETRSKVGKEDLKSGTIWGEVPDKDLSVSDIMHWVKKMQKKNILSDKVLGKGATKKVLSNDKKTVFKFNHDVESFGNQIVKELLIYNKFKNKYKDLLPKFYDYGSNWVIQEAVKPLSQLEFERMIKMDYDRYARLIHNIDRYLNTYKDTTLEDVKDVFKYDSEIIDRIVQFCIDTKASLEDMFVHNLGLRDGKVVIVDFGI